MQFEPFGRTCSTQQQIVGNAESCTGSSVVKISKGIELRMRLPVVVLVIPRRASVTDFGTCGKGVVGCFLTAFQFYLCIATYAESRWYLPQVIT